MKRYFVQLAHKLDTAKHPIGGMYLSEKMDGSRCLWDGGVSRGLYCNEVPWANVEKDGRLIKRPVATGLWSRYGNRIAAPDWFLDALPRDMILDGELYAGRGRFQFCRSACAKHEPVDEEWEQIQFVVIDAPCPSVVFSDGDLNEPNFKKKLRGCYPWYRERVPLSAIPNERHMSFQSTYTWLRARLEQNEQITLAPQEQLPFHTENARGRLEDRLSEVLDGGGEGLIVRKPSSMWFPHRVHECLKYKPYDDAEGTVVGYVWGRETDKGSKLLGLMGALILEYNGKRFELSGFTDFERRMSYKAAYGGFDHARESGTAHPGETVDPIFHNHLFPIGSVVTFRFREHTDAGIPKEARFFRRVE